MNKTPLLISLAAALVCGCSSGERYGEPLFEPYVIENLEPAPDWWKVKPSEIIGICSRVTVGKAVVEARTPLNYPVYAVYYGDFSEPAPQSNWSASSSTNKARAYLGERDHLPTILFIAGVHGSEPESVAAATNMISLLETGRDLRGRQDPEFLELASRYRLIIMPCVNMDGRLISPDHFRNQPYEVFRGCSQGWWKDGSLIGWLGSKEWFPLPLDKVKYPGGYPNSEGYNIQHDADPAGVKTEEAGAVCRIAARYRADLCLNCHSCEGGPYLLYPSRFEYSYNEDIARPLVRSINDTLVEMGLSEEAAGDAPHETYNLTTMLRFSCGGLCLTSEVCHSCYCEDGHINLLSFDQMMESPIIILKMLMRSGAIGQRPRQRSLVTKTEVVPAGTVALNPAAV